MFIDRTTATTAICALSALLAACGSSNSGDGSGQAAIDFYNELTDTKAFVKSTVEVDLFANSGTTALLSKQKYATTSADGAAMVSLSNGQTSFTAQSTSGNNTVVQNAADSMQDGKTYTTVLMGDLKAGQTVIQSYEQQTGTVAKGKVSIRFINALSLQSPSAVNLKTSAGDVIANGLSYTEATGYQTLSPFFGFLTIHVTQSGATLASPFCFVKAGKSYDAILAYTSFKGANIGLYCHELTS
jgi:hypothetical protein